MAFKIAGSMAVKEGAKKADPVLLEPIMAVEVVTPEDYMGDVIGDLNRRRGLVQGMDDSASGRVITAEVPLSEMFGYATDLRSATQRRDRLASAAARLGANLRDHGRLRGLHRPRNWPGLPPAPPLYCRPMDYRCSFRCVAGCEGSYDLEQVNYRCPKCGELLEVHHDLEALKQRSPSAWIKTFDERAGTSRWPYGSGVWGKKEWVVPHLADDNIVSLGEGWTPLLRATRLGRRVGVPDLFIKDESQNPTQSFKARGMATAVSMAKELGARKLAVPSAGNAAGALAAYAARAGLKSYIFMPRDTPRATAPSVRANATTPNSLVRLRVSRLSRIEPMPSTDLARAIEQSC